MHVADGVALLETFYLLARHDAIKLCVEKKTSDIYLLFKEQVERIRHEFDERRRRPPLRINEPQFAGSALWAKSLAAMVTESWDLLQGAKYLVRTREAGDAEAAYTSLLTVLNDFKAIRHGHWAEDLHALDSVALQSKLENPLMRRVAPIEQAAAARRQRPKTRSSSATSTRAS